jgi:hypothetical protein
VTWAGPAHRCGNAKVVVMRWEAHVRAVSEAAPATPPVAERGS